MHKEFQKFKFESLS